MAEMQRFLAAPSPALQPEAEGAVQGQRGESSDELAALLASGPQVAHRRLILELQRTRQPRWAPCVAQETRLVMQSKHCWRCAPYHDAVKARQQRSSPPEHRLRLWLR